MLLVTANEKLPRTCSIRLSEHGRGARYLRPEAYTEDYLQSCGFVRVAKSCVVLDRVTGAILTLFLTSNEREELLAAARNHERLLGQLQEVYGGGKALEVGGCCVG